MKNLFKSLVTALCLTGCFLPARDPQMVMHVDKDYTATERQCIADSVKTWKDQTSGVADVTLEYDLDDHTLPGIAHHSLANRIVRWDSTMDVVKAQDGDGYKLLGQVNGINVNDPLKRPIEMRLVADRLTDPHMCRLTAIHELGHVFGIPHLEGPSNIMFPYVLPERTACLKHDDLTAFCLLNDCGKIQMHPCEDQQESAFPYLQLDTDTETSEPFFSPDGGSWLVVK